MFVIQKRYNYILYPYVELSIKFQNLASFQVGWCKKF